MPCGGTCWDTAADQELCLCPAQPCWQKLPFRLMTISLQLQEKIQPEGLNTRPLTRLLSEFKYPQSTYSVNVWFYCDSCILSSLLLKEKKAKLCCRKCVLCDPGGLPSLLLLVLVWRSQESLLLTRKRCVWNLVLVNEGDENWKPLKAQ